MGSRRVAVTQVNAAATRVSGQDAESPRHAASPSKGTENSEDGHSRLAELEEKVSSLESEITVLNSELDECRQIGLLQRAVSSTPVVAHNPGARLRIPEPKAYSIARDVKEVENFFFDMEQYFLAADVQDEARKVSTTTMYLLAIREQFFLENVEYNARRALQKLKHTGSVWEYVKAFSALMLNIRDMSEKDKLFTFMEGLKPWARLELQRQRVTDLSSAVTAAERLADFNPETRQMCRTRQGRGAAGAAYASPHRFWECPKKQLLNALATFTHKASPSKSVELQASTGGENDSEEDEDNLGVPEKEEEVQPRNLRKKRLMLVDVKIHGQPIRAVIDTGASHNYLASAEVARLGLVLEKRVGHLKAINSAAQPIAGVAKFVLIKVGAYEGKTNISVVVMDDFKLILGLDSYGIHAQRSYLMLIR
ncbi:UNVERIFIED_CONTAM: hypothetical protein Sindi_2294300 [Sesamum indicum]